MLIMGDGGVGKTSLLQSLKGLPFNHQESTQVLSMETIQLTSGQRKNNELQIEVTDFGGKDIYRCFHSLMMSNSCVYVLVFHSRQFKAEDVDLWISYLRSVINLSNSRIVIVFTHCYQFKPTFSGHQHVHAFYNVDNKTKTGIEEFKEGLLDQFYSDSVARITFSMPHEQLISKVLEYKSHFSVNVNQFKQWTQEAGFKTTESTKILLKLLHENNYIFYFDKVEAIKDIVWTNPDQFIEGLRCILSPDPGHSQYINNGILWNEHIPNAFEELEKEQHSETEKKSMICGLIELLRNLHLIFPAKSKEPPFEFQGYIIPARLPNNISDPIEEIQNESHKARKVMVRSVKVPRLFVNVLFQRLMSMLWKHIIDNSYCQSVFCLEYNKTKALVSINYENQIFFAVWGKYPLKFLSMIYYSIVELMKQTGIGSDQIQENLWSICSECFKRTRSNMGDWPKRTIQRQITEGERKTECHVCGQKPWITDLLFNENILYIVFKYGPFLIDKPDANSDVIDSAAREMDITRELFPMYDSSIENDKQNIQRKESMGMDDWNFFQRLGKSRYKGFYGANSAVYLSKSNLRGLENSSQFYAVKVIYNYFQTNNEESLLENTEGKFFICPTRTFVRQICHFTDRLNIEYLPDWDADSIKNDIQSLFVVSDAYDDIIKHVWSNNHQDSFSNIGPYILQLLMCLKDLQNQNIVHRDIKSDNFFYSSKHDCYLLADFGEAIRISSNMETFFPDGSNPWQTNSPKPPEVTTGKTIDFSKADLYSMGHMLLSLMSKKDTSILSSFSTKPAQEQGQIIKEHLEQQEYNISDDDRYSHDLFQLKSLIFAIMRNDFDERISVQDAIHAVQYLSWGQNANQNDLEQWKENIIRETATQDIPQRPMTMNDMLKIEYVSSLTLDKIEKGKQQCDLIMRQFENPNQPLRKSYKESQVECEDREKLDQPLHKFKKENKIKCEDCIYDPPYVAALYCHNEERYYCGECSDRVHQGQSSKQHEVTSVIDKENNESSRQMHFALHKVALICLLLVILLIFYVVLF